MHVLIYANGLPAAGRKPPHHDLLIAADGGARYALQQGLLPDIVVGDFDSLPPDLESGLSKKQVRLVHHPERKDETDLELALDQAKNAGAAEITCMALLGGRPDMSLANLLILASPRFRKIRMRVLAQNADLHILHGPGSLTLDGQAGERVSAVPLGGNASGISNAGLEWPLANETLAFGSGRGLSNHMSGRTARIELREGVLLVTHEINEHQKEHHENTDHSN